MDNQKITKIDDTTAQIQTTSVASQNVTLDQLTALAASYQADIDNNTASCNKNNSYLQSQIDIINAQIKQMVALGILTQEQKNAQTPPTPTPTAIIK